MPIRLAMGYTPLAYPKPVLKVCSSFSAAVLAGLIQMLDLLC